MSDWPNLAKTVLGPLAREVLAASLQGELAGHKQPALSLATWFSRWASFADRAKLSSQEFDVPYLANPGVYVVASFGGGPAPTGRADPLGDRVVYVGITNRTFGLRLGEFQRGFEQFRLDERTRHHPGGYGLARASDAWGPERVAKVDDLHIAMLTIWVPGASDEKLALCYHHLVERLVILQHRLRGHACETRVPRFLNKD